jgi:biopolymer transport protein ExbD
LKRRKPEAADIDMTPMIDCTFQLIIFFLCCEFKTLEGKLSASLPKEVGQNKAPAPPIETLDLRVVNQEWGKEVPDVHDGRRFDLEGHRSMWYLGPTLVKTIHELEQLLRREVTIRVPDPTGRQKPRPLVVKSGRGVTYGDVTEVIDLALDAGFEEIRFGGAEGNRKSPATR